ncbi:nuclear transport factor 2 family protein [Sphingomonas crocodyli]|uniref:Nuclear transport factor 2 family protein n=1 Tax=Sphingomonas crocodyli TaxID=1979270 RepID=A0A437LVZ4_9SPHN|nr:nuclear transport factor 2 family protein [Sphingomonas crocodyli]RVT89487.1 nuclear transport factor 2 family protein [Sphingomonas crocodyli]
MNATERLEAIEAIKRLKAAYFRTMDMKDWEGFRDLFITDCTIDTSEAFTPMDAAGKPIEADRPAPPPNNDFIIRGIDTFIAAQHFHLDGVSTVHHGHMPEIDLVSDDEATGLWAMEDKLRWPADSANPMREMHGYGHYRERYVRVDGRWKIASLKLTRIRIDMVMK